MLTKLILVITLQYIQILFHYVVHLKLIQYYIPIILQFKKKWLFLPLFSSWICHQLRENWMYNSQPRFWDLGLSFPKKSRHLYRWGSREIWSALTMLRFEFRGSEMSRRKIHLSSSYLTILCFVKDKYFQRERPLLLPCEKWYTLN